MTTMEPTLVLDDIRKTFVGKKAVDGVSFQVAPGTIFGLIGRNGAGKTTTLRMIAGVFHPDSGTLRRFGATGTDGARDRMAYLPEERGLYRKMRLIDQVVFFAEIKGKKGAAATAAAEAALRRFELFDERNRRVEELSKGNQQKVQLAGTLVSDPDLILLDEPMSGLDPVNVVLVRELLLELRARGKTIVLSTHMMGEAEKLCDEVCLIHQGLVVLAGKTGAVRASRGVNAVQLEFEGTIQFAGLPGVEKTEATQNHAELLIKAGTDTNELLAALLPQARILRFVVAAPSLEEVFVARVGAAEEAS